MELCSVVNMLMALSFFGELGPTLSSSENEKHKGIFTSQAIEICQNEHLGYHMMEDGTVCCNCKAATHLKDPCRPFNHGDPMGRNCSSCIFESSNSSRQFYMPHENNNTECFKADDESFCLNFMNTHSIIGSNTTNRRCECDDGHHVHREGIEHGCFPHQACSPGYEATAPGTNVSNTKCRRCPKEAFSNITSMTEKCFPHTVCKNGERVIQQGNKTSDNVCGLVSLNSSSPSPVNEGTPVGFIVGLAVGGIFLLAVLAAMVFHRLKHDSGHANIVTQNEELPVGFSSHQRPGDGDVICDIEGADVDIGGSLQNGLRDPLVQKNKDLDSWRNLQGEVQHVDRANGLIERGGNGSATGIEDAVRSMSDHVQDGDANETTALMHAQGPQRNASRVPIDRDRYADFATWDDLNLAEQKGGLECCIQNLLENFGVAKDMMETLLQHTTTDILPLIRKFLTETEITDVKKEYRDSEYEIRQHLISELIQQNLTPRQILNSCSNIDGVIKDGMVEMFFHGFQDKVCH